MRRLHKLLALSASSLIALVSSGCTVHEHITTNPPPPGCSLPTFGNYTGNYPAFHVSPNDATQIAGGDRAFALTSNGTGTYHLTWTDTTGADTCFTGLVTSVGNFAPSQVTGYSGHESVQLKQPNQIAFASVPGASFDGVDFFADQDPVYLDVFADGSSAVNIYFTETGTRLVTVTNTNIAAFYSP